MILLTVTPMMLPTGMTPHILEANMTIPLMTSRMRHISMTLPMVSGGKASKRIGSKARDAAERRPLNAPLTPKRMT